MHEKAKELVVSVYDDIKDHKGSRVDRQIDGLKVTGYWVQDIIRVDIKFPK